MKAYIVQIFYFGLEPTEPVTLEYIADALCKMGSCTYSPVDGKIRTKGKKIPVLMKDLKYHCEVRIKPELRDSIKMVYALLPLSIFDNLAVQDANIEAWNEEIKSHLSVLLTIHRFSKIITGTMALILSVNQDLDLDLLFALRSSDETIIASGKDKMSVSAVASSILEQILPKLFSKSLERRELFHYVYSFLDTNHSVSELHEYINKNLKQIRGVVTGDRNWDKKKDQIVRRLLEFESSTRDSYFWFIHPNGTLKILSSDFETDHEISFALGLFELIIILAVKALVATIYHNVEKSDLVGLSREELLMFLDSTLNELEKMYVFEALQKETTLSRYKKALVDFHIDSIRRNLHERINLHIARLNAEFEKESLRHEFIIAILFGTFGIGGFIFQLISFMLDYKDVLKTELLVVMLVFTAISIYGIYGFVSRAFSRKIRRA